ncbi:MAG: dihydrolipoyl dehydrogenase [Hydrogenophilaceae bacterium]|jgi:dihydrolipoamide dehydrogenase|nr:dihydrolipoyl dehydrogenase [Hydrogenophilaceae bacterium]
MSVHQCQVLVVGGGPGGYVAAIRAGQLGLDVILVEADRLGGTCLIRGCIPSKAIIHVASEFAAMREKAEKAGRFGVTLKSPPAIDFSETVKWKDSVVDRLNGGVAALLKRAKVRVIAGWAEFTDAKTCTVKTKEGAEEIRAENVILAAGSLPVELPFLPFGGDVISSTEALSLPEIPKRLAVVGAGYIGLELGIAFRKLGAEVAIVEAEDRILPLYDAELVAPVKKWLDRHGVALHLAAKAKGKKGAGLEIEQGGKTEIIPADKILVTVGRRPNTDGWGLENMGLDMAGRFVKVDDRCRTAMRGVYAVGDLVGEPMLEHKAATQGEMVAEIIAGRDRRFDQVSIPAVCFTEPEIITAGLSPDEAKAKGEDAIVASFPLAANGRALSMDAGEGFIRIVARKSDHLILGIQAVGAHASELSGEFSLALEMRAVLEDLAGAIHVHPTMSEALHEAALRALGHAIHI